MTDKEKRKQIRSKKTNRDVFIKYFCLYLFVFIADAVVITLSILTCKFALNIKLEQDDFYHGAGVIMLIVLATSLLFVIAFIIIQEYLVNRPVERIRDHLEKISEGDFDKVLEKQKNIFGISQFNTIIDDINSTAQELKSINTLRNDFVNNISHEFKTPLAIIQNYSQLLQDDDITGEERVQYAKIISSSVDDMNSLVTNALKLNRIEHQKIFHDRVKFSLIEQLSLEILNFENEFEIKNINVETDFDEEIILYNDENLIKHIWQNLLSNAVKFCNDNGTIVVTANRINDRAVVTISDNGCGISEEEKPHIFEKYFQGDTVLQKKGNGLGLPLVKRIADVLDIDLSFESELGVGTTFVVSFKA